MDKLSVVIPSHNRADILPRTLQYLDIGSIVPDEVIVVDDASDAPVRSVLDPGCYSFPLRIIRHDKCRMRAGARNTGILAARYPLLLMIDDDIFADHDMVRYHKYLHKKHPEPGYAVSGRVVFDPEITRTPVFHYLEEYGAYRWLARLAEGQLYTKGGVTANLSVKLDFVKRHGLFDEGFPSYGNEDTEFSLRLMEHGLRIHFHHAPSGRHHRGQMGLTGLFNAVRNGGHSKAYWAIKRPDDSSYCRCLEAYARKHLRRCRFEKICGEFMESVDPAFLQSDVSECSPEEFEKFREFLQGCEPWLMALGIISGWKDAAAEFDRMLEEIQLGLYPENRNSKIRHYENAYGTNPDFFPMALLLTEELRKAGRFEDSIAVLMPFRDYIWAKLSLGQLSYCMSRYEESLEFFLDVYDKTGHDKAVEDRQRAVAKKWLLKLLPEISGSHERARRMWDALSENDRDRNPEWAEGLETELFKHGETGPSFKQRFPRLCSLQAFAERMDALNKAHTREYPLELVEI